MLRWGDARAEARQVGRAPVGGQPRNKGGPVAVQPCCLPEHKQHSPRSVSGRYPGDTWVSGSVYGQRVGKPATNMERAHCPGPHMCPRGHPHVTLQYMCTKHTQDMCVYASHICLCMEHMSTRNCVPMCVGIVHMGAPPVDTCLWHMWKHPAALHTRFSFFKLQSPILGSASESKSQLPN